MFVNEKGQLQSGVDQGQVGMFMEEVLEKELFEHLNGQYLNLLENGDRLSFIDEIRTADGNLMTNESLLTAIRNDKGIIDFVVAVSRDITASVHERKRLIDSEQRYRSIIDHNMDAVFSLDRNGEILEANKASGSLLGFSEEDLIGCSIYDFVIEEEVFAIKNVLEHCLSGESIEKSACWLSNKRGHQLLVHLKSIPIIIDGEIPGIYLIVRDITEHSQNTETIKYLAFHDQLTGLWNRRALLDHLQDEIPSAMKIGKEMALLYLDLDRFKFFNDTLGHKTGDDLLRTIAERLTSLSSVNYRIYRQGGDEFIILLFNGSRDSAEKAAQEIMSKFSEPMYVHNQEYYITPSIGISIFPADGKDTETLIKSADSALFQVKEKGKAHYRFYQSDMNVAFPNFILMESHLRRAIEKEELLIYYQPQVNLATGKIESFEALLRWQNRKFGFVTPSQFIPLAEDTGLIIPIGEWVIENVCEQLSKWRSKGYQSVRVAINISPKQFQQHQLPDIINRLLKKYKLPPDSLEIEITEGAMQDTRTTLTMLNRLKEIGIIISVDDFGTGYSSLNYLKRFPLDILKIDQTFVKEIQQSYKDAAITKTIIHLAHSLGLEVVAEGVEEMEQVEFLLNANCQKAQGFYFSKPVSALEIEEKVLVNQ
ncbi:EAL domain-containing protein [Falsibacillus albus]|uniref:EAL domain-containing protein n=2 Tax=Falsibacillus albus TaxID=2478915 RepID=A0A3L7JIK1_9BACI|nr:EAL domain-containing protein [Falsibacillus albus]